MQSPSRYNASSRSQRRERTLIGVPGATKREIDELARKLNGWLINITSTIRLIGMHNCRFTT